MPHLALHCTQCGESHPADMASVRCVSCGSTLEVTYDVALGATGPQLPGWSGPRIPLPLHDAKSLVSLGEGNTPCVELGTLGRSLGLQRLHAKLEFFNPTGSFKDRGTAIMMSMATELGVSEVVEDSSGNAGASVSAYAARAGIKAHVFAPAGAPQAKIQQIKVYGAEAHLIDGPREAATDAALAYLAERRLVYASHNLSPFFMEGIKTFAYEVARQLPDGLPRHLVIPVGNGSLFIGAWKGLKELQAAGQIKEIPSIHCVQARAFMPIVAAHEGRPWTPSAGAKTVAGGICSVDPPHRQEVLSILSETGGVATAVDDDEILRWQRLLAEQEGIYAEPTSAAAFAGLDKLVRQGHIHSADPVLVPVTGSGLKDAPPI